MVTPVSWAFAPAWLTIEEASHLSGHDASTLCYLIDDGGVEAKQDGTTWLIEKDSLLEYQEALVLVLHWNK